LFAAASTPWLALAIGGLIIFGLGRGAFDANQMPIVRELVDEHHSATAYGLLNFIGTAAGGVMVYVGGALMDRHVELSRVFQFCGLCLGGVALILLLLPKSNRHAAIAMQPTPVEPLSDSQAALVGQKS
jgi:MFS family permease